MRNKCPDFLEHFNYIIATGIPGMLINSVVDLSHWNPSVNFKLAKEDGIVGVIHKATQGIKYIDPEYAKRRKAVEEEGFMWGAYHFGIGEDGKDQAEHF